MSSVSLNIEYQLRRQDFFFLVCEYKRMNKKVK